jgi:glycerol kinase
MYFTGSPFESAGLAAGSAKIVADSAGWPGPFLAVAIRTAKASGRRSAAHSAARNQWELGAICIRNNGRFVRPIIVWKVRRTRCLFRGVARKGNGASIYRAEGRQ